MTRILHAVALLALFATLSVPLSSAEFAADQPRMVNTKLIRPGVNGVAGVLPVGMCLFSDGFSRDTDSLGREVTGLTGFYTCTVYPRIAIQVVPVHWVNNGAGNGPGDISVGAKFLLAREKGMRPLVSTAYSVKIPLANQSMGSGYLDHKITLYADKRMGRGRVTANYAVRWVGARDRHARVHTRSVAVLHPVKGKFGMAMQAFNTATPSAQTYGLIAAATYHVAPNCSLHAGLEKTFRPTRSDVGFVWGITTTLRLWKPGW